MEWKASPRAVKMEGGEISGFGAMFENVDGGGDRIAPGAFANSLASGRRVRMLRDHDPTKVIGRWDEMAEADGGLRVRGSFSTTPLGQETRQLVADEALDGLSIGFKTIRASFDGPVRVLEELELWEVSVVTFPMNDQARVDAVKALADGRSDAVRRVYERAGLDAGLDSATATKAADAAIAALTPEPEPTADELAELWTQMRKSLRNDDD